MAKKPGLGILLPVERGSTGYFNQGFDALTQVRSNLTNLILTRRGERIMQPEFGCRVHELLFDNITDELVANVRGAIEEAIQYWLPFVIIEDLSVDKNEDSNEVYVTLTYRLKTNVKITDTITLVL